MMILPVAKAVAAAFAGSLAFSTGRNMLQTQQLLKATDDSFITDNTSVPTTVSELQTLQRKQLLQLYLQHCEAPTELSTVAGDWHGVLLKNNGLTPVTRFITNKLFGKVRRWNGKSFDTERLSGLNRFEVFSVERDPTVKQKVTVTLKTETDHSFDIQLANSRLCRPNGNALSILVTYAQYHGKLSLWRSMVDELRILPTVGPYEILVGLGCMGWSGGILNCSPFCLYRLKKKR